MIQPDADGDGFGDETEDGCPSQATTHGACDTTKPGISALRVSRGTVSYRLSEAASVHFTLARKARRHLKRVGHGFDGKGDVGLDKVAIPRPAASPPAPTC